MQKHPRIVEFLKNSRYYRNFEKKLFSQRVERKKLIAFLPRRKADERGVKIAVGHPENLGSLILWESSDKIQEFGILALFEESGELILVKNNSCPRRASPKPASFCRGKGSRRICGKLASDSQSLNHSFFGSFCVDRRHGPWARCCSRRSGPRGRINPVRGGRRRRCHSPYCEIRA